MRTYFGRPEDQPPAPTPAPAPPASVGTGARAADLFKRGRDTVVVMSPRGNVAVSAVPGGPGQPAPLPPLTTEQRVLLRIVDGRMSIARLARMAGFSEDAAAQSLAALCQLGVLAPAEPAEVTVHGQSGAPFFKLGPYEIAARVGQGGMGSVYVCRRIGASGFQRLFALKVVRQNSGQDEAASRAFVRELNVGRMLTHPNVQSVVDVGMYSDQPFLVLDYIEGADLEELSSGAPLPPGVLLTILIDLLRGLQAAHDAVDEQGRRVGLVHGDVSPPNILIGLDGVARLADFGNARFSALGETGQNDAFAAGKPAFMAPEIFRGEPSDGRADLFAMGVVMWTALTGQELFAAETYDHVVRNVLEKEIVPPSTFGAPACLDDVCMRALSRHPRWRYGSANDLAEDLLRVAVENRLRATPTQVAEYVRLQVGATLAERRQRIEQGFRGVRSDVPPPVAASSPEAAAVPSVGRKYIAPTVVLPERRSPPQDRRTSSPSGEMFGLTRATLGIIAVSLAAIVFAVTTAIVRPPSAGRRATPASPLNLSAAPAPIPSPSPGAGAR